MARPNKKSKKTRRRNDGELVDVRCQCGWGRLGCPSDELPAECPVCSAAFAAEPVVESNPPLDLSKIKVLWREPDVMSLWGIPYEMRQGQSPRDLYLAEWPTKRPWTEHYGRGQPEKLSRQVPSGWIWLGTPGWWGSLSSEDQAAIQAFLAGIPKDMIPSGPGEWVSLGEISRSNPRTLLPRSTRGWWRH